MSQEKGDQPPREKLGFNAAWAMAVGGMIGGEIFATLGVVITIAGELAWLSFVLGGLISLLVGYAYFKLATQCGEGGGAYTFLRNVANANYAGALAWVLLASYVLTSSVYASTFGVYLAYVLGLGDWFHRLAGAGIMLVFLWLNLRGTGESGRVEVLLVWFKVAVLLGIAAVGLARWDPGALAEAGAGEGRIGLGGYGAVLVGAAVVFVAYEGFQLLAYDYDELRDAKKIMPWSVQTAIVTVMIIYVLLAIGSVMLVGVDTIIEHKETSLAIAGHEAAGLAGLLIVTVGVVFTTGSAINSTLFASSRLARQVARDGELPEIFARSNAKGVPSLAVIVLALAAAVLTAIGNLMTLVEAASLAFLFTFTIVCALAFRERAGRRWINALGTLSSLSATIALAVRMARQDWWSLAALLALVGVALFLRPPILRRSGNQGD